MQFDIWISKAIRVHWLEALNQRDNDNDKQFQKLCTAESKSLREVTFENASILHDFSFKIEMLYY